MNIVGLASDHNGITLKEKIRTHLKEKGYIVIDIGPYDKTKKVDYVDYANQLCQILSNDDIHRGILICGTGVGMSIAANRFDKVRAALVHNVMTAPKSREHNDSNVLCLGSWTTTEEQNFEITDIWLQTNFGEGRHIARVEKLSSTKKQIVFTNGVFDILHAGHLGLLRFAKSLGDKLVVGINSDRSVRELKGENRPINNEEDRKKLLEALEEVDEVVVYDELESASIIEELQPSIIVKGGEWNAKEVRRRDKIPDKVDIKIYPLLENYSTTNVIKKIYQNKGWEKSES